DLAYAFARDAELLRQLFQRGRLLCQATRFEDAPLALVEHAQRRAQRLAAVLHFLTLGHDRFLAGAVVREPVLPLAGIASFADRRVERDVAAETAVHLHHVDLADAEGMGERRHLFGAHVALVERRDPALRLAQAEEQLLLARRGADFDQRPRAQDVFL